MARVTIACLARYFGSCIFDSIRFVIQLALLAMYSLLFSTSLRVSYSPPSHVNLNGRVTITRIFALAAVHSFLAVNGMLYFLYGTYN